MTRTEVATEVGHRLGALLADAEIPATDTQPGLKPAIDDALAVLGVAYVDRPTAAPADADRFRLAVEIQALRAILRALAPRFDTNLPGGLGLRLKQAFDNARLLLIEAEGRWATFGGPWIGRIDLGWVTPDPVLDEYGAVAG